MARALLVCAVVSLTSPAYAHTDAELADWSEHWQKRATWGLSPELLHERTDWESRHPCRQIINTWTEECTPNPRSSSSVYRGMGSDVEQWRPLVSSYPWDVETVLCLIAAESGGNPDAYNSSSGASGLMQVLASWAPKFGYKPADLFIPEVNLDIAYALYADGGWGHWSPWNRGECR